MKKLSFLILTFVLCAGMAKSQVTKGTTATVPACTCNVNGWSLFSASIANNQPMTVKCGFKFKAHKNQPFKLDGKYLCNGDCAVRYSAKLKNNIRGAVVNNYPSFSFPWTYPFTRAGNYKLEITPICGDKRCPPCVYYITVN